MTVVPYQPHSRPISRNMANTLCAKFSVVHHSTHSLTPSHPHTFTPSHPHTTPSLPHTLTSSHLHFLTLTPSHPHSLTSSHPHTVVYSQEAKCVELGQELAKGKEEVSSLNIKVKWAQNKLKTETEAHKV